MKKLLILIAVLFITAPAYAQIGKSEEIAKWETIGIANKLMGFPKLQKTKVEDKDYYSIYYRNIEYQQLQDFKSFYFYATPDELSYLYDVLQKGGHNEEPTILDVGKGRISVKKKGPSIIFNMYHPTGETDGWWFATPKQLGNMFGIKYDKKKYKK
jgi:hypothetical protein